jgi:hypothetical protein
MSAEEIVKEAEGNQPQISTAGNDPDSREAVPSKKL